MVNNNGDFNYYIHKTGESNYEQFFQNGLIDFDKIFRIESTMERISDEDIKNGLLQEKMKVLRDGDVNVFLIKIPKAYFPSVIHQNGKMDVPIPVFSEIDTKNKNGQEGTYPVLIPNLIQGCYNKEQGFITNPNYCPVFDPSGLKFAYEQIEPVKNNEYGKYMEYNKRNSLDIQTLYDFDKANKTWDPFVRYYAKLFGVNPTAVFDGEQPPELGKRL